MFYSIHEIVLAWEKGLIDKGEARTAIFAILNKEH